ncbi:MAG TPA: Ig-like domain-containing protein, partial [Longimicrobium sp.]
MRRFGYTALLLAAAACDQGTTDAGTQVATVTVTPGAARVGVGQELALSASVLDPASQPVAGARVGWQSLNPAAATVSQDGRVRGVANGVAQVVATARGRADTASITVGNEVLRSFNVNSEQGCSNPVLKDARQVASSSRALIFEDV